MYDNLIHSYRVIYEGARAPIFYKTFYPTGIARDNQEHWDLFHYARGLKSDKPSDQRDFELNADEYVQDLRDVLNRFREDTMGLKRGVVVIPSSTANKVNRVTELVRKVVDARHASTVADLTWFFLRTKNKEKSHLGGTRSASKEMESLYISPDCRIQDYGALLVLDDITTTGSSFLAADTILLNAGFGGILVNFAFARTLPSEGVDLMQRWATRYGSESVMVPRATLSSVPPRANPGRDAVGYRVFYPDGSTQDFEGEFKVIEKAHRAKHLRSDGAYNVEFYSQCSVRFENGQIVEFDSPDDFKKRVKRIFLTHGIDGIVFDLDDTLISDTPRDLEYEQFLRQKDQTNVAVPCPYKPFEGVRDFMDLGIPFTIVSNRPVSTLRRIVFDPVVNDTLYPGRMERKRQILEEWQSSGGRFYPLNLITGSGTEPNQYVNLFSYQQNNADGYGKPIRLYKPCPQGVLQAVQYLSSSDGLAPGARIIGIGNTLEDMIAYSVAGIESSLALWGVPDYLQEFAQQNWGASHCFSSFTELVHWCSVE